MATSASAETDFQGSHGLLKKGVIALLEDKSFLLKTQPATAARKIAENVLKWITVPKNLDSLHKFEDMLLKCFKKCMQSKAKAQKARREKMWESYHSMRTSESYRIAWKTFLETSVSMKPSPIFCQYVGDIIFKEIVRRQHPLLPPEETTVHVKPLTYMELNAIRYAAGYIPRALQKKLPKSKHPLKKDIQLCILDLLDDGSDEEEDDSHSWVNLIDRGRLTHVNNTAYEIFVQMEMEVRRHLSNDHRAPNFDEITTAIVENEDVLFLWSILGADWEESSSSALLQMVANHWVRIRGFSLAIYSAWIEKYKVAQKQTTQKSKGIRKQLVPKPQTSNTKSTGTPTTDSVHKDSPHSDSEEYPFEDVDIDQVMT